MHPFFAIWIAPRSTVRSILDTDPSRGVIALSMLCGAALVFVLATAFGIVARDGARSVLVSIAIDGPIVGLVSLFFVARALAWSGQSFLGGKATERELRGALAWTATVLLWIGALAAVQAFVVDRFVTVGAELHQRIYLSLAGLAACLAFAGLVLFFKAVGEAHGFSAWKAIVATIIALVAFALVLALPIGSLVLILELL
jgi:hypothetical protein